MFVIHKSVIPIYYQGQYTVAMTPNSHDLQQNGVYFSDDLESPSTHDGLIGYAKQNPAGENWWLIALLIIFELAWIEWTN